MKRLLTWFKARMNKPSMAAKLAAEVHRLTVENQSQKLSISILEGGMQRIQADAETLYSKSLDSARRCHEQALESERLAHKQEKQSWTLEAAALHGRMSKLLGEIGRPFEPRESVTPPPFDDDDKTRWREFLATPTGRRLAQGLNWWAQYKEQQATLTTTNQAWHCGEAAGYRAFGVWALHSLSADTRLQQGEDTRAQNGASDLRERIAP